MFDSELDIMLILWDTKSPVSASYILSHLQGKRSWALPTLMTILARMCKKGYILCEKAGRNNTYIPLLQEKEYKAMENKTFLEKLHGNSLNKLIASLFESTAFSGQDIDELQTTLNQLKREE